MSYLFEGTKNFYVVRLVQSKCVGEIHVIPVILCINKDKRVMRQETTKFIFIYGAPASGKLTIGKEFCVKTGFSLFHNHVSVSFARSVLDYGTERYHDLVVRSRMLVFDYFIRMNLEGLVFTWAYSHPHYYTEHITYSELFARHNVTPLYVRVTCPRRIREQRLQNVDRVEHGKIHSVDNLRNFEKNKKYSAIPGIKGLTIDSSKTPPEAAASIIISNIARTS